MKGVYATFKYFQIQAYDEEGVPYNTSLGPKAFIVTIDGHPIEVKDRGDGSYLASTAFYRNSKQITVAINTPEGPIEGSPWTVYDVRVGHCDCPEDVDSWKKDMRCRVPQEGDKESHFQQKLNAFPKITLELIEEALKTWSTATMHYTIKDNRIYGRRLGPTSDFRFFTDFMLLQLQRQVRLPDSEFLFNLGDYPAALKRHRRGHLPIFSWCGNPESSDIILPTYTMMYWTRQSSVEDLHIADGSSFDIAPWEQKIEKLIWRGRDSSHERLKLVEMGNRERGIVFTEEGMIQNDEAEGYRLEEERLLDVGLTRYFFFTERQNELGTAEQISFIDHWKYKYILNMDGTVAAYRLGAYLAGNSVVFKQDSPFFEHFYYLLEPYVHYIPVARDLSDLEDRIKWAKANDDTIRNISKSARELMRTHVRPEDIWCTIYDSLVSYSKKLDFEPRIHPDMEEVTESHGTPQLRPCHCNVKPQSDEL